METVAKKKRTAPAGSSSNFLCAREAFAILRETPSCTSTLRRVHKMLLGGGPASENYAENLLARGFLRLIPSILSQPNRKGVARGIEVLSALAMSSFTTYGKVVCDKDAMCALTAILVSTDVHLLTAACHAVVDLLITPVGCEALKDFGVLNHLLHLVCWIADCSKDIQKGPGDSISSIADEPVFQGSGARKPSATLLASKLSNDIQTTCSDAKLATSAFQHPTFCKEFDEVVSTALIAISVLLRYCGSVTILNEVLCDVLNILRGYWHSLLKKDQILLNTVAADDEPKWSCNLQNRHVVATCVVQLAMEYDSMYFRKLSVQQSLFESAHFTLELFLEKYWEQAPVLLSREMPSSLLEFSKNFTNSAASLNNFLGGFVACPRPYADQLDCLHLFVENESNLGEPMVYGQDIRIVKTVFPEPDILSAATQSLETTVEMHYNRNGATSGGQDARHVSTQEILEAVDQGYTVAIKGMELRCPDIADTADCLARQCGQPSVGVNLYLTPPNAQGLDLHIDDHCVFVCQLVGRKTWNVFPPQKLLPRLHACRALDHGALNIIPSTLFNLEEGDVLYIPRGFPHKAHCGNPEEISRVSLPSFGVRIDTPTLEPTQRSCCPPGNQQIGEDYIQKSGSIRFGTGECGSVHNNTFTSSSSLHLTFGVEVEPPFEWEGLVHIALRLWAEERWNVRTTQSHRDSGSRKESHHRLEQLCEGLLHIAVNILGGKEIQLRKACMIAAESVRPQHSRASVEQELSPSPAAVSSVLVCGAGGSSVCKSCNAVSIEYFQALLELVAQKANYKEAYSFAKGVSDKYAGSFFSGMEWLRHVPHLGGSSATSPAEPTSLAMTTIQFNELRNFRISEVEATFTSMKAEFSQRLMFHQASSAFMSVWNKCKNFRMKFMNGMLALQNGQ